MNVSHFFKMGGKHGYNTGRSEAWLYRYAGDGNPFYGMARLD